MESISFDHSHGFWGFDVLGPTKLKPCSHGAGRSKANVQGVCGRLHVGLPFNYTHDTIATSRAVDTSMFSPKGSPHLLRSEVLPFKFT